MTIVPKGYYCDVESHEELPILVMDANEILERTNLNVANTASSLRRRVLEHLAKSNGHGPTSD
jgi:hypothetical protein